MIGGFGNLTGEMDFWDLTDLKQPNQIGKAKSYCTVGIEWAANGSQIMTSVLYERVRVDNMINIFTGTGERLLGKGEVFEQLQFVQWQPVAPGTLKPPSLKSMQFESEKEIDKKPKRVFAYGGSSSAFSQIMREEMGKMGDQGPRKIDSRAKEEYKEISTNQANIAKEKAQQIKNQKEAPVQPKNESKGQ